MLDLNHIKWVAQIAKCAEWPEDTEEFSKTITPELVLLLIDEIHQLTKKKKNAVVTELLADATPLPPFG